MVFFGLRPLPCWGRPHGRPGWNMQFWPDHRSFDRSTLLRVARTEQEVPAEASLHRLRRPRQEAEVRLAAPLSRRQAGTGGSGRSFIVFVDRGRRSRFDSRRPLAPARPEQEVPSEASLHHLRRPRQEAEVRLAASLSRCQAGTGGSGRSFTSSSSSTEAGGRGATRGVPSPSTGRNRRFRPKLRFIAPSSEAGGRGSTRGIP